MKRNKTKGLQSKKGFHPAFGSSSVKADRAREMVKAVKAGDWQAYSQWLQQCQLENALAEIETGEFYIA